MRFKYRTRAAVVCFSLFVILLIGSGYVIKKSSGSVGDVVGPASATNGEYACFNGTSGKLLKECSDSAFLMYKTDYDADVNNSCDFADILKTSAATRVGTGSSVPGTCITGQLFTDNDDDDFCVCVTTNTWKCAELSIP